MGKGKQYWLLKTEPGEWSWEDQEANGGLSNWDGVKNKQAQKHLKAMHLGDLCFFYHSGAKARRVVGVVSVVREWYEEGEGVAVDVKRVGEMRRAVDLGEMKKESGLAGFGLFRHPDCRWCRCRRGFGRGFVRWEAGLKGMAENLEMRRATTTEVVKAKHRILPF